MIKFECFAVTIGILVVHSVATCFSQSANKEGGRFSISTPEEVGEDAVLASCENHQRLKAVEALFERAQPSDISTETFKKVQNVVVRKKGASEELIVIGAHYDKVAAGCGAIDNWIGIVAITHVYRTLRNLPMNKTLLFVAFGSEEEGLLGSRAMVKAIDKIQSVRYCAMINIDSLGMGIPQVVENISSKKITTRVADIAKRMGIPFHQGLFYRGNGDSSSFLEKKIPAVTIHGLAGDPFKVIHTANDQPSKLNSQSVYLGYRLVLSLVADVDKCTCDEFR
jgi:Zn-dependent M28 family amino/carboxypeptidase